MLLKITFLAGLLLLTIVLVVFLMVRWIRNSKIVVLNGDCKNLDPELKKLGYRCACSECTSNVKYKFFDLDFTAR